VTVVSWLVVRAQLVDCRAQVPCLDRARCLAESPSGLSRSSSCCALVFVLHSLVLAVLESHAGSWVLLVGMEVVASPVLPAVSFLCPVYEQVVSFCFLALAPAPRWRPFEKE
jgi:hypothetical protein